MGEAQRRDWPHGWRLDQVNGFADGGGALKRLPIRGGNDHRNGKSTAVIRSDKLLHILAGIAIASTVAPFGAAPAFCAVLIAAIGKELYDRTGRGTPELLDAVATVAGGVALLAWHSIIETL
jgi:hypothetical protein